MTDPDAQTVSLSLLLVEDDERILGGLSRMLTARSYVVHQASSGVAALQTVSSLAHLDVLVTDVVLTDEVSGVEVAAAARSTHPDIGVIFMSGYDRERLAHTGHAFDERCVFLNKPFTLAELIRHIDTIRAIPAEPKAKMKTGISR